MITGVAWAQVVVGALFVWILLAFFVAWAKYERWLRRRRTGPVEVGPSCSRKGRVR